MVRQSEFARKPARSSTRETHDQHGIRARSQGIGPHHSGLPEARDHVPRHHHAPGQRACVSPRGRRTGPALGGIEDRQGGGHRGARLHPGRRGGAPGLGRLRADPQEGQAAAQAGVDRLFAGIRPRRDGDARGRGGGGRPCRSGGRSDRHRRDRGGRGQASAPTWRPGASGLLHHRSAGSRRRRQAAQARRPGAHAHYLRGA